MNPPSKTPSTEAPCVLEREEEYEEEYEMPAPGNPKVVRAPLLPRFNVAPGPPIEKLVPLLDRFSRTPGIRRTDLRNRNPIAAFSLRRSSIAISAPRVASTLRQDRSRQ